MPKYLFDNKEVLRIAEGLSRLYLMRGNGVYLLGRTGETAYATGYGPTRDIVHPSQDEDRTAGDVLLDDQLKADLADTRCTGLSVDDADGRIDVGVVLAPPLLLPAPSENGNGAAKVVPTATVATKVRPKKVPSKGTPKKARVEAKAKTATKVKPVAKATTAVRKTPVKVKTSTPAKQTKGKKGGIGDLVCRLIRAKKSNEHILQAVKAEFPGAKTNAPCVNWYRNKLSKGA